MIVEKNFSEAPDPEKYERSIRRLGRTANMLWEINVSGLDNIPTEGPAILAFSHRSRLDPFIQGVIIPRAMSAMMKDKYQNKPILGKYFAQRSIFFIDYENPRESLETAYSALERGMLLDMNPEGTSTHRGAKIEAQEGTAALAVKAEINGINCPIVPIGMDSEHLFRRYLTLTRHLPIVIGHPFRANITNKSNKAARKETNEELERRLQFVFDLSRAIHR